jgi:3-phenylpropionate/trans-cinnamate dioxygenase ferredoxin reductase component
MAQQTFVVVGASLAGASAAVALRKRGFDGRIALIGEETEQPYERPELSKAYLRGEAQTPKYVQSPDYYAKEDIELLTGIRAERIDVAERRVVTANGTFAFDRLLIATGAEARGLPVPGSELDGVLTLRTVGDADRISRAAETADSIVVVGGGWIGSEVAASLRQLGHRVTMVLPGERPLEHVLGPEVGEVYRRLHEDNGVALVTGTRVARLDGRERVSAVVTEDGRTLAADLVVVGVGARPRTELASAAGMDVDDGILVDQRLESSVPGIFAAGDVASAWHPTYGRRLRVEHWDNAKRQGRVAAANMLGQTEPYERIPYFYSDQYDLGMEYSGFAPSWDQVVFRGDPTSREFVAFWLSRDRVVAGMNVNVWDVAPAISRLIESGVPVHPRRLANPAEPLEELAPAA